ncbi:MAG TPA: sodium:solute symporter [Pirellulales bacterium]|nr:sodium:solute symporter [Pirellulales bacterium]
MDETTANSAGLGTFVALLIFIAASVWLGTLAQRVVEKGSFLKGYFLGNRGLGAWALALTATVQSGGTFMGFPSMVYSSGWIVALWIASYMVVPITGFGVLGKRISQLSRRTGAITVPDLVRERFGSPAAGLMASLLILLFMSFMMVAQFKAGALVMKISWPGSGALALAEDGDGLDKYYYLGLGIFSLTVVGYTLIGGFLAAVWTDLFQSVMMFIGVMILLPLTVIAAGGLPAASQRLAREVAVRPLSAELREENKAHVEAVEQPLHHLDAALRRYADEHDGRLPQSLADRSRDDGRVEAVSLRLGEPQFLAEAPHAEAMPDAETLRYFGADSTIDGLTSQQRTLVALTEKDSRGWQSALYSNGKIVTGKMSRPGALATGPGPFEFLPLGIAVSFFFQWVFAGLSSPAGLVRIMASKSTPTIRRSIVLLAVYNMCIYLPLIVICICGRTLIPDLQEQQSDEIIPRLALLSTSPLPGGSLIAGLILAAPFGAVMATVSTYLVVIASGLVRDVYLRFINPHAGEAKIRWLSHLMMVIVGAAALGANLNPPRYLQTMVILSGTCAATSFFAPAMMIAYWRRATAPGAMAAMIGGVFSSLSLYAAGWVKYHEIKAFSPLGLDPIIWGLAISSLLGVVTSLCTEPPDEARLSRLFDAPAPQAAAAEV